LTAATSLGGSNAEVMRRCTEEDRTLVTNNYGDFRRLCESQTAHPGLIVLPTPFREKQQQLLDLALAHVEQQTKTTGTADPGEFKIDPSRDTSTFAGSRLGPSNPRVLIESFARLILLSSGTEGRSWLCSWTIDPSRSTADHREAR
jgi:hypothetical protein